MKSRLDYTSTTISLAGKPACQQCYPGKGRTPLQNEALWSVKEGGQKWENSSWNWPALISLMLVQSNTTVNECWRRIFHALCGEFRDPLITFGHFCCTCYMHFVSPPLLTCAFLLVSVWMSTCCFRIQYKPLISLVMLMNMNREAVAMLQQVARVHCSQ